MSLAATYVRLTPFAEPEDKGEAGLSSIRVLYSVEGGEGLREDASS